MLNSGVMLSVRFGYGRSLVQATQLRHSKDYVITTCCLSTKHAD